jgi:hypothetical protein
MYRGTLFLNVIYTDSNKIIVTGDNKTIVLDKKGDTINEFVYSEDSIISVSFDDSGNTVICYEEFGGSKTAVVRISKSGENSFSLTLDDKPDIISTNRGETAVLSGNEIVVYNSSGKETETIETEHPASDIFWCSGTLYSVESGSLCQY